MMNNKRFKSGKVQELKGSRVLYLCIFLPLFLFTLLFSFTSVSAQFFGGNSDFLEQVFSPSKSQQQVINIGNDKQAVGNEVLRESINVQIGLDGVSAPRRDPLIVRFTKFLLRITIVLSITMTIYTGIRYMIAVGSEEGTKNAREHLLYIVLGILLALMSLGIVTLLESITFSTLSSV